MSVCVSPLVQPTTLKEDIETLLCRECPKTFSSTKILQQHQQMFHTEKSVLLALKAAPDATAGMDRAFICETCGKAFRFRSNLAEHRSVHTALKPYVCKFCGKSSRLKGNLTKHILKHHKKEHNEAIAKDDIIVKKAPKIIKTEPGTTSNGTTSTTSTTTTATSDASPKTNGINGHSHNNNNNIHAVNNNLRTIKTEVEDPDYTPTTVTKPTTHTVVAKIVSSTPRSRPTQQKETPAVTTVSTPALIATTEPEEITFLPKDEATEFENFRNIMISLGLEFDNNIKLPDPVNPANIKEEISSSPDSVDSDEDTPLPDIPPVGGSATLALIVAAANASLQQARDGSPDSVDGQNGNSPDRELSPDSDQSSSSSDSCPSPPKVSQCKECGKVMKRRCHLPIHMTMSHGFPPPSAFDLFAERKMNVNGDIDVDHELRKIALAIEDLKAAQAAAPKVEDALTYIDNRVGNLEKSLETALNSIYTLVQLQSGMTSSVNRLREDSARHFNDMKERLDRSWSPRRIYRRSSVNSDSRERSRSRSP